MRRFSSIFLTLLATILTAAFLVSSTPVPCTDEKRDAILNGDLHPSACCGYGVCVIDLNAEGNLPEISVGERLIQGLIEEQVERLLRS